MRKLLLLLIVLSSIAASSQQWSLPVSNHQRIAGLWAERRLKLPADTSFTKEAGCVTLINGVLYVADGTKWNTYASGGGSSAGVSSFDGRFGAVVPQTGDYTINMITGGLDSIRRRVDSIWVSGGSIFVRKGSNQNSFPISVDWASGYPTYDGRYPSITRFLDTSANIWSRVQSTYQVAQANYSTTYSLSNDIRDSLSARYTKAQSDARFLQSFTEGDPVWTAAAANYYTKTQADARYLQSFTETDPTVYAWAKAATKPSYAVAEITGLQTALDGKQNVLGFTPENAANKGVANGFAALGSDSKILAYQLPQVAINQTFTVNSQSAMLALSANQGDIAVRTDQNKAYILAFTGASTLANWIALPGVSNEADPVFTASVAYGITGTNVSNWNTAFGWGNHAGLYRPVSWVPAWTDVPGRPTALSAFTNDAGFITGINSIMVTTALGFTPYNATNPNGFITSSALSPYALLSGANFTGAVSISNTLTFPLSNGIIFQNAAGNSTIAVYNNGSSGVSNLTISGTVVASGGGQFASSVTANGFISSGDINVSTGNINMTTNIDHHIDIRSASAWNYRMRTLNDDFIIQDAGATQFVRFYYNGGGGNQYVWQRNTVVGGTFAATGASTFSSSVTGRNYILNEASANRGGLYTYNQVAGSGTDYSIGLFSEGEFFIATGGSATKRFTMSTTGATTFSSTIQATQGTFSSSSTSTNLVVQRTGANAVFMQLSDASGSHVFLGNNGGEFVLQTAGGGYTNKLSITSAGAATFSSDIRSNGIFRDYQGEALLQTSGSETQLGSTGAGTPRSFRLYAGNATALTISTSQAATFSSSVTAGGDVTIAGITFANRIDARSGSAVLFWNPANTEYGQYRLNSSNTLIYNVGGGSTLFSITSAGAITAASGNFTSTTASSSTTTGALTVAGGVGVAGAIYAGSGYFESDERLKDISYRKYFNDGFDVIKYTWKQPTIRDKQVHWGYSAQQLLKVLPEAVSVSEYGYYSVDYNSVHTYEIMKLKESIMDLHGEIFALKIKLNDLKAKSK